MGTSRAFDNFLATREEISYVIAMAKAANDAPDVGQRMSRQQLIVRTGMVFLVGSLHNYLEELMQEFGDLLGPDFHQLSPIGQRYVAVQVHLRLTEALAEADRDKLGQAASQGKLLVAVDECSSWIGDPRKLASSASRPRVEGFFTWGANAIERALTQFRDDGTKFFAWLTTDGRYSDYYVRVSEAIAMRNEVAHGSFQRQMTLHEFRVHRATIDQTIRKAEQFLGPSLAAARLVGPTTSAGPGSVQVATQAQIPVGVPQPTVAVWPFRLTLQ